MLKNIAPDKWKHFWVGIAMGIVFQAAALWLFPDRPWLAVLIPLLIIIAISYGFELFSRITGKGHYEILDAIAAIIGGVIGMAAPLLYHKYYYL